MTAPDWVPLMRRAAAIVTDSGGMTCHAAIVSRELGIPCVVGTGDATKVLRDGEVVTVDAGAGVVTEGDARSRQRPQPPPAFVLAAVWTRKRRTPRRWTGTRARQPLRALAAGARGRSRRRRRRPAAGGADGGRGARGRRTRGRCWRPAKASASSNAWPTRSTASPPPSRRGRSPTGRSTSAVTSSAASEGGERFEPEEANPMIGYRGALRYMHEPDLLELELRRSRGSGTPATRTCT